MTVKTTKSLEVRAGGLKASLEMDVVNAKALLKFGTTTVMSFTATALTPVLGWTPSADGTLDLGDATHQYRDAYFSRNLINSAGYYRGSVGNTITAFATGGQGSATALAKDRNFITVCATAGDSAKLPVSVAGMSVYVHNSGAAAAQIFGAGTDTINGIATATGVPLPTGRGAWFFCNAAGTWFSPDLADAMLGAKYSAAANTTNFNATAAQVGGAYDVILNCTGALGSGQTITLPTVAALVAAIPNAHVGQSYRLRIINSGAGAFAWTVTTNTGWTLTGTMTVAQNTFREFVVTLTSLAAAVIQSAGQVIVASAP
jgi:hypothetical protein